MWMQDGGVLRAGQEQREGDEIVRQAAAALCGDALARCHRHAGCHVASPDERGTNGRGDFAIAAIEEDHVVGYVARLRHV